MLGTQLFFQHELGTGLGRVRCKLQLYDKVIEQIMSFTYLGIKITSHQDLEMEVKTQSIKVLRILGCLNNAIWPNKFLRTEARVRVYYYKTMIRPILTYAAETRPDTSKTRQMLETAEMKKTLRRFLDVSLFDKQRSEGIRGKM